MAFLVMVYILAQAPSVRLPIGTVLAIAFGLTLGLAVYLLVAVVLAVVVHELGHLVGGLRSGFDFRSLTVGPIEIRREKGRLKFERAPLMRGIAGLVRMVPTGSDRLEQRLAIFILGGPIASLFWTGLTFALYRAALPISHGKGLGPTALYLFAFCLCAMGLSFLPGTLIPFTSRSGMETDAKILLALWGKSEDRGRIVAQMLLGRDAAASVRARDWSPELLEQARFPEDGSAHHIRALLMLYYHHLDRGEVEVGCAWLAQARLLTERLKKGHLVRECVFLESAFCMAWFNRDLVTAERELEAAGKENELLSGTYSRAEAAITLRKGNLEQATKLIDASEASIRDMVRRYGGNPQVDYNFLAAMREEILQPGVGLTGSNTTSMP